MTDPQVRVLRRPPRVQHGPKVVHHSARGARGGRHPRLRVDRPGYDLRLERHSLLRRHLPRRQPHPQERPLLDEPHLLRPLRHRDAAQVDGPRLLDVLHQLLDSPRLHHRFCKL